MATKSKRQQLREQVMAPRRRRTPADREKMGRDLISRSRSAPPPQEKVLLILERQELHMLNDLVAKIKPTYRRASRNSLIRCGIAALKGKSPDELEALLRNLP
jgi:hypothetical protein